MLDEVEMSEDSVLRSDSTKTNESVYGTDTRHEQFNVEHLQKDNKRVMDELLQTPCSSSYLCASSGTHSRDKAVASLTVDSGYCNSIVLTRSSGAVWYEHHSFDSAKTNLMSRDDTESHDDDEKLFLRSPKVCLLSAFDEPPESNERRIIGTKGHVLSGRQTSQITRSSCRRRSLDSDLYSNLNSKRTLEALFESNPTPIGRLNLDISADFIIPVRRSPYMSRRSEDGSLTRERSFDALLLSDVTSTTDTFSHSTPMFTSGHSRKHLQFVPISLRNMMPTSGEQPICASRIDESDVASFDTRNPFLDDSSVRGCDTDYSAGCVNTDLISHLHRSKPSLAKNVEQQNLTVEQQEKLECVLRMFAPAALDRLIGRKMGLDRIDFIEELNLRSVTGVLRIILEYVDTKDLIQ